MSGDRPTSASDADGPDGPGGSAGSTGSDGDGPGAGLTPRHKSALLWGAVGALSFLVLVQGYALFVEQLVSIVRAVAIAALVGIGAAIVAYAIEGRVSTWAADRSREE